MGSSTSMVPSSSTESPHFRSHGSDYQNKLCFDPKADKRKGPLYFLTDDELLQRMDTLLDESEEILNVYVYTNPLSGWQLTYWLLYHAFVVFETEEWWWSIEKNGENITIQRSKIVTAVRDSYRRVKRVDPVGLVIEARGKGTMRDLINMLWKKDHLNRTYHYLYTNCKYFAAEVFNFTNCEGKICTVGLGCTLPH